jgi:hypothetical protein
MRVELPKGSEVKFIKEGAFPTRFLRELKDSQVWLKKLSSRQRICLFLGFRSRSRTAQAPAAAQAGDQTYRRRVGKKAIAHTAFGLSEEGLVKIELGSLQGQKRLYDKRSVIKERDSGQGDSRDFKSRQW